MTPIPGPHSDSTSPAPDSTSPAPHSTNPAPDRQPEPTPSASPNPPFALSSRRDLLLDPERSTQHSPQTPPPAANNAPISTRGTPQSITDAVISTEGAAQPSRSGETPALPSAEPASTPQSSPVTSTLPPGLTFRLAHLGVAVPALDPAAETLRTLLGYRVVSGPFDDPIQKVSVNFLAQAPEGSADNVAEIELIAPLTPDSPITSMLKKTGGGAYHLCFETNHLEQALDHVKANGCIIVSPPNPAVAFAGRRIAWFYTPNRQLIELVEASKP